MLCLRRALSFAGTETQVMSLWRVDDEATRALMICFVRKSASGAARSEALRAAQLDIAADPRWADPRYWAAFIAVGASVSTASSVPTANAAATSSWP